MPSFPDICFTDAALCCPPCQVKGPCFVWPTILFTPDTIHFRLTWRAFPPAPLSLNSERSGPEIQASSFSWTLPVTRLTLNNLALTAPQNFCARVVAVLDKRLTLNRITLKHPEERIVMASGLSA